MLRNLNLTGGLIFSEKIMLSLVEKGVQRKEAYEMIQSASIESMDKEIDFKDVIKNNDMIKKNLNDLEVELLFDTEYFLKYVDQIFKRLELS